MGAICVSDLSQDRPWLLSAQARTSASSVGPSVTWRFQPVSALYDWSRTGGEQKESKGQQCATTLARDPCHSLAFQAGPAVAEGSRRNAKGRTGLPGLLAPGIDLVLLEHNTDDLDSPAVRSTGFSHGLDGHPVRNAVPVAIIGNHTHMPDSRSSKVGREKSVPVLVVPSTRSAFVINPRRLGPCTIPTIGPIVYPNATCQATVAIECITEDLGDTAV
jgi:hypothetical protein